MTDWIRHDSSEPPELAPAALVEFPDIGDISDGYVEHFVERCEVRECPWVPDMSYRQLRDEDGNPYISADGLEEWAEYVATEACCCCVMQHSEMPILRQAAWHRRRYDATMQYGPAETHRHPGDWRESLYRVWRD